MLRIKKRTSTMKVCVPWDDAIDAKKSDLKKYLETLDMDHLKFRNAREPSIIHITSSPQWVTTKLMSMTADKPQAAVVSCFRYSVEKIENLKPLLLTVDVEIDGGTGVWIPDDTADGPNGTTLPCISEDLALTAFNMEFMTFISSIVQKRAFLRPGKSKPYAQLLSFFLPTTEKTE